MFSDKAAEKLKELADSLFAEQKKPPDNRRCGVVAGRCPDTFARHQGNAVRKFPKANLLLSLCDVHSMKVLFIE
jgi:hypothetical protein